MHLDDSSEIITRHLRAVRMQSERCPHWTLTGSVTVTVGGPINGAVISVLDGPEAGKTATTDGSGRFTLANLAPAGFTLRAVAALPSCEVDRVLAEGAPSV
jgi:hypothetical protein